MSSFFVTQWQRTLHPTEVESLYGACSKMQYYVHLVLVGNPESKRLHGGPKHRRANCFNPSFNELGYYCVVWILWSVIRTSGGLLLSR